MLMNALTMWSKQTRNVMDRQVWIKIFREAAKSTTFSYVLPLYLINLVGAKMAIRIPHKLDFNRIEDDYDIEIVEIQPEFIEIFSETHASAERFTMNIRAELEANAMLKHVFGNKMPQNVEDEKTGFWRRDVFITSDDCIVYGNGSGQQSRGMLMYGRRPTLAIFDDIYSRKNTMTEDTREKIRYWFNAEAINSVDSQYGKVMLLGTMLHEDTVFTDVAKSEQWRGYTYPVIEENELNIALKHCIFNRDTREIKLPSQDKIKELQDSFTSLAWKERQDLYYILSLYKKDYENNRLVYFYQEKLNILMSPDDIKFTDSMVRFDKIVATYEDKNYWLEFHYQGYKWKGIYEGIIGIDIASAESAKADDTAIVVCGYAHVYPQLEGYDIYTGQSQHKHKSRGITIPVILSSFIGKTDIYDNPDNGKRGICNIVELFARRYGIKRIVCEVAGQQALIAREIKKHLRNCGINSQVIEETSGRVHGIKEERITSILLPILQSHHITIFNDDKNSYTIWSQLKHLGMLIHDDGADAFATGMLYARKPIAIDYQAKITDRNPMLERQASYPSWEVI